MGDLIHWAYLISVDRMERISRIPDTLGGSVDRMEGTSGIPYTLGRSVDIGWRESVGYLIHWADLWI